MDESSQPDRDGGRRRLAPEARRAEILNAALDVFAELGFERATLQDIADRAGVTKGALYHYFESKDQLFIQLVRERLGILVAASEARVAAAGPSRSREELLEEHLAEIWSTLQQPHMLELSQLVMTELPKFPEVGRAFFEEIVAPARQTMRRILERRSVDPARGCDDADTLVAILPSMLLGVALTQRRLQGIDPLRLEPEHVGRVVIRALLDGIARPRRER